MVKNPVVEYCHLILVGLSTTVPALIKSVSDLRDLMKKQWESSVPSCSGSKVPYMRNIVCDQYPLDSYFAFHSHLARSASFWIWMLMMLIPPFCLSMHTLFQLIKQFMPLHILFPFQKNDLLIRSMCFITPFGILIAWAKWSGIADKTALTKVPLPRKIVSLLSNLPVYLAPLATAVGTVPC